MKKALLILVSGLVIIAILVLFRAHTTFKDTQLHVTAKASTLNINEHRAVERFAESIRFPTISYDDSTKLDKNAFSGLRTHIENSFPLVHANGNQIRFNEYSLLYEFKGTDPTLKPALFMGHLDVVPVDKATEDQWQHDAFSGAIEHGIVWGRGTIDDKVTVFALLEAMEALLEEGITPSRTVFFAFGHDEEIGGKFGAASIAAHFQQLGTQFEFVLDEGGAITEGVMNGMSQPVALIGIAEKGFVNLRLTVKADGGHSSQPPDHTAVGILSQAIVNIENTPFETDIRYTQMTFDELGYYAPLGTRIPMANLWLLGPIVESSLLGKPSSAAAMRSTIAATMMTGSSKSNILPTLAEGVVNIRILPGDTVASVKQHIIDAIDDPRVEVTSYMENEPSAVSPTDSVGFSLIEQHIRQLDTQVLVAPYLVLGGTDSKHFYGLSDNVYRFMMVRLDPEGLKRFHGVNEQLPAQDYINAVQFFYEMLKDS